MKHTYDGLKLENQLCFPLYACAKEVVRKYTPYLEPLGLTYTQYIAMMVIWEKEKLTAKELGNLLTLDSGTLTPMLKKLESKGYITRERSLMDERNLNIKLTKKGRELKEQAVGIPDQVSKCVNLNSEETDQLYGLLQKVLDGIY